MLKYCLIITITLILALCRPGLYAQSIVINSDTEYQTIDGFGGMNHTSWVDDLTENQRKKAFSNDPGYMGLSILRVHIDPNSNRFPEQLPTAQYATSQGARILASPWDPPAGLIDDSSGEPVLPYQNYGAYVEHLNSFNEVMLNNGVPLYAISVQNEPDIGEWTSWTQSQIFTFVNEFAGDINTRVMAAESFNFKHSYTDAILNDSAACANLDIVGGHIYGNGLYDYPLARQKGKPVWMTEHLTGSDSPAQNGWELAMSLGQEINKCMEANFSAYIWWYIRRFYSLIRENGNISEKGYVMMHYSKFVRPGAIRVGAVVNSASGVYATAFKTDTSMCIVAVNKFGGSREITFDVADAGYSDFVKFTSTENNYMVNQGTLSAQDGTFTLTLEDRSISTFTTSPGAGGRYDNIPPVADAGEDLSILLDAGQTSVPVTLDASASSDPDGHIVEYYWEAGGKPLSSSVTHDISVPEGEHSIVLTVMDNDGTRSMDTLVITVKDRFTTNLWFEAECAEPGSNWDISPDQIASNNYYVTTPPGMQKIEVPSDSAEDHLRISFTLTEEGEYKVWGRVIALTPAHNSFWVKMDDSEWTRWDNILSTYFWYWDDVHADDNAYPVVYDLEPGDHTLLICYREDEVFLDKIMISNTGHRPSDMGGEAQGCTVVGLDQENEPGILKVYPNPSGGNFHVDWDQGFSRMEIISADGKVILTRNYSSLRQSGEVKLRLDAGIYLLRLLNNEIHHVSRLMIK